MASAREGRFSENWPKWAFVALVVATGFGMTLFALRGRKVIEAVGVDSRIANLIAVACPALIGTAILAFGFMLLPRRPHKGLPSDGLVVRGTFVRLSIFVVPIMATTQMAAVFLGKNAGSSWTTLVVAGLLPLVPITIVGFGILILSAASLFRTNERADADDAKADRTVRRHGSRPDRHGNP